MNGLFTLVFIGAILYFMFRKGGMGCCGGHGDHDSSDSKNSRMDHPASHKEQPQIIDLSKADYTVLPPSNKEE